MEKLLLITVLLVMTATKLIAQNKNAVEIKKLESYISKIENNQFKIIAHEEVDINLKFNLEKEDDFNVHILDKYKNIVFSKKYNKVGENKINFIMEEEEQYTVKFINTRQENLILTAFVKN
jgi:hypothetical protein